MATYNVICTCKTCGANFEKTVRASGRDAENKIEWTKANFTECPECYNARRAQVRADFAAKYNLPQIEGTAKQIAYAGDLRMAYIKYAKWRIADDIVGLAEKIKNYLNGEGLKKFAENFGGDMEKARKAFFDRRPKYETVLTAFTATEAHEIIERLNWIDADRNYRDWIKSVE